MTTLRWKRTEEAGYPYRETHCGRYEMEPLFNHATRPYAYNLYYYATLG